MSEAKRLLPWIGGATKPVSNASYTALVSPVDEQVTAQMIESDAAVIDAAVKNAHDAYLAYEGSTTAVRVGWLSAAAAAIDKIEEPIIKSLIRDIGKPRKAATFEAKRAGQFLRACAAFTAAARMVLRSARTPCPTSHRWLRTTRSRAIFRNERRRATAP